MKRIDPMVQKKIKGYSQKQIFTLISNLFSPLFVVVARKSYSKNAHFLRLMQRWSSRSATYSVMLVQVVAHMPLQSATKKRPGRPPKKDVKEPVKSRKPSAKKLRWTAQGRNEFTESVQNITCNNTGMRVQSPTRRVACDAASI